MIWERNFEIFESKPLSSFDEFALPVFANMTILPETRNFWFIYHSTYWKTHLPNKKLQGSRKTPSLSFNFHHLNCCESLDFGWNIIFILMVFFGHTNSSKRPDIGCGSLRVPVGGLVKLRSLAKLVGGWIFQPIWKIWVKMGSSSPIFGVNIQNLWVATTQLFVLGSVFWCFSLLECLNPNHVWFFSSSQHGFKQNLGKI